MIVRAIALYYQKDIILACCFLTLLQVTGNNPKEAIVKVAEGNVLKERPRMKQSSLEEKKVTCISYRVTQKLP